MKLRIALKRGLLCKAVFESSYANRNMNPEVFAGSYSEQIR
jgi:hypothetical protein